MANAMTRLRHETANSIWRPSSGSRAPNACAITSTIPKANAAPSRAPTAAARRSYAAPSNVNISTRCPRRVPIARAMPSSPRRSVASITKMRKMSRIPAAIENVPNVVKKEMKAAPVSSAASMASCFTVCTSRPSLSAAGCR